MQRADAWTPVAARVARSYPTVLVDFDTPTLDACMDAVAEAVRDGAVVGYSMGGRIALHAALRPGAGFRALVLVGATAGIEDDAVRRSRRAADAELADWMAGTRIDGVVDYWESQPVFGSQDPDLVTAQRAGRLSFDPAFLGDLLRATGQGAVESLWPRLPELTMPVLAIAGEDDDKYADIAKRMAAAIPLGRAAIVPGAGHAPQLEQPDAVADLLLTFLDQHLG